MEQGRDLQIGHILKKVMFINKNQELFTQDLDCMWPPDVKSQLTGKDPDAGKDGSQKEKGLAENEMVRWDHQLNGHEFHKFQGIVEDRGAWCAAVHWIVMSQT